MKAMTKLLRRSEWAKWLTLSGLLPGLVLLTPFSATANPSGAAIVHGDVLIDESNPAHLLIQQGSDKAIINWQDFSIGAGELTQFVQPGAGSIALNRVVGGNPSSILGTLQANGGIILINQNGILVGGGGVVDIGGLAVLSTLDIDDQDFLDGGDMRFFGGSSAGVTNLGTITSRGGDVVLLGNFVDNQGVVGAPDGTVAFGAGGEFIVDTIGDSRLSVIAGGPGGQTGISNSGTVEAAAVEFKAHGNVYALAIQNTGIVRANGVNRRNGRIILSAAGDGTVGGRIENTGTLQARNADGSGGEILIDGGVGGQVDILGGHVDADGDGGRDGGSITVLGDVVNVTGNALVSANGGNGGTVQLGSVEGTSAVTVGPNASVQANGSTGNGGVIEVLGNAGSVLTIDGELSANGARSGGVINLEGGTVNQGASSTISAAGGRAGGVVNISGAGGVNTNGAIRANTVDGSGGRVIINGAAVNAGQGSVIDASGALDGGIIDIDSSGATGINGDLDASATRGEGGRIDATGQTVNVGNNATVDASGALGGGQVNIGGGFQGSDPELRNAQSTVITDGARIKVDSSTLGNAGRAVVWADGSTMFRGEISAQALGSFGNGGLVEVSGKDSLIFRGSVDTRAANGETGLLLLDPTDVTVQDGAGLSSGATLTEADVNSALAANHLLIQTGGAGAEDGTITIERGVRIEWGTPNTAPGAAQNFHDFTLLATGDVNVNGHIISHGGGNVNLFAGWDGTTGAPTAAVDPAGIPATDVDSVITGGIDFTDLSMFGTPVAGTLGNIRINSAANDQAVQVGSRFGETNAVGNNLILEVPSAGSDRFAHLGYRATTNPESGGAGQYGLVNSTAGVDLTGTAFDGLANSGNINVQMQGSVLMLGETANDSRKYTQIGHGGNANVRDNDVNTGGTSNEVDFSLINADHSGDITVDAGLGGAGTILLQGGRETGYSRIGHGGLSNPTISEAAAYALGVSPGDAAGRTYQQIYDDQLAFYGSRGGSAGQNRNDALQYMYNQVYQDAQNFPGAGITSVTARGLGSYKGDIHVQNHSGSIAAIGNPSTGGWGGYAAIGHGGMRLSRFAQTSTGVPVGLPEVGDSALNMDTTLGPQAIDPDLLTEDGNPLGERGNIFVRADGGSILFEAGGSSRSHVMIGHGGHENPGNVGLFAADGSVIEKANITVYADQNIEFTSPVDNDDQRFVRIGHGGFKSPGNMAGDIDVDAGGDILFKGGDGDGHAQIGHGGVTQTWGPGGTNTTSNQAPDPNADGSNGIQGTITGNINVDAGGDITFRSGLGWADRPFSMIGHGGYGVNANSGSADDLSRGHHGDIVVNAGGAIDFMSSQPDARGPSQDVGSTTSNQAFSMIGHGGRESRGDHYGKITVNGESIRFEAVGGSTGNKLSGANGDNRGVVNFVQIGHGGYDTDFGGGSTDGAASSRNLGGVTGGPRDSTITLTARSGDISFIAPQTATVADQFAYRDSFATGRWTDEDFISFYTQYSWAQIGHGGYALNYAYTTTTDDLGYGGDIDITAGGALTLMGSDFQQEYSSYTHLPSALRDTFNSRRSERNWTQIGHGGFNGRGDKAGNISIMTEGDISLTGGMGLYGYSQIGHGGWDSDNGFGNGNLAAETHDGFDGSISVISNAGGVLLHSGNTDNAANIGDYAYTQIGHGGRSSGSSVIDDDITVRAGGGNVELLAGFGFRELYSMIGHGGRDSRAQFLSGNIDVFARDNIYMRGTESGYNQASSFSQIGHGGWDTEANENNHVSSQNGVEVDGDITVTAATGDIIMVAGVDNQSIASGGADNGRYAADRGSPPNTGFVGNTQNPAPVGGFESDGYIYAGRGNLTERPNDDNPSGGGELFDDNNLDGNPDGDDSVRAQGGWAQIGHGGQHTNITQDDATITVTAGDDLIMVAGEFRDAKVAIGSNSGPDGWGSNQARRRTVIKGDIDVTVGGDLQMHAGSGDNATVKIGAGGYQPSADRSRVEGGISSFGRQTTWEGDINVKVGGDLIMDADTTDTPIDLGTTKFDSTGASTTYTAKGLQAMFTSNTSTTNDFSRVLIGHKDTTDNRAAHNNVISNSGDTYVAVSRNDPSSTGTGRLITRVDPTDNANGVVFSSARNGTTSQLRLYMPSGETGPFGYNNFIAEGTILNADPYTRTPVPDGTRTDELEATEFTYTTGVDGEPFGAFTPEGSYPVYNGYGYYAIYYAEAGGAVVTPVVAETTPVVAPVVEEVAIEEVIPEALFNAFPFLGLDTFDAEDRDELWLEGDSNFWLFSIFGLIANDEYEDEGEDTIHVEGEEILEESPGMFGLGPARDDSEEDDEENKSGEYLNLQHAIYGQFWTYQLGTSRYSSLRIFGVPAADTLR